MGLTGDVSIIISEYIVIFFLFYSNLSTSLMQVEMVVFQRRNFSMQWTELGMQSAGKELSTVSFPTLESIPVTVAMP